MSFQSFLISDFDRILGSQLNNLLESQTVGTLCNGLNTLNNKCNVGKLVVDMFETDKNVVVRVQVPGLEKENITLNVNEHVLEITTERKHVEERKDHKYHVYESSVGKLVRSVKLPKGTDTTIDPTASLVNGILEITFVKNVEKPAARQIQIN